MKHCLSSHVISKSGTISAVFPPIYRHKWMLLPPNEDKSYLVYSTMSLLVDFRKAPPYGPLSHKGILYICQQRKMAHKRTRFLHNQHSKSLGIAHWQSRFMCCGPAKGQKRPIGNKVGFNQHMLITVFYTATKQCNSRFFTDRFTLNNFTIEVNSFQYNSLNFIWVIP